MVKTKCKWKKKITRLNLTYLSCLKEAGWQGDTLATLWGVPEQLIRALGDANEEILYALAQVGAPLIRIQADQMQLAINATSSDALRAKASLLMNLISGGEDGGSRSQFLGDGA